MVTPSQVIAAVIAKIEAAKEDLGIKQVAEGSEDVKAEWLKPPYCLVYANFEDAAKVSDGGTPFDIPITIGVACVSTEHKTASAAFTEAFTIATKIIKLCQGDYDILIESPDVYEPIVLKSKDIPLRIGTVSSAISSVICFFNYYINLVYDES